MNIRCAKCGGRHSSVVEVAACHKVDARTVSMPGQPLASHIPPFVLDLKTPEFIDAIQAHEADEEAARQAQKMSLFLGADGAEEMRLRPAPGSVAVLDRPKVAPAKVEDGRYAVEEDGVLKFFKLTNGRKPGYVFLDIQASDDWHSIRNVTRIKSIVALIAVDSYAAMIRYGRELGACGHCGRTLTDESSRAAGIGPICAGKYA